MKRGWKEGGRTRWPGTVSYTHLAVYKRQLPDRAVFSAYDFFVAFQLQPGDFKDLFDIDAQLVDVPAYVLHQLCLLYTSGVVYTYLAYAYKPGMTSWESDVVIRHPACNTASPVLRILVGKDSDV